VARAQADRQEQWKAYADVYEESDLKRANARALSEHMNHRAINSEELTRELAIKSETTNPWYFGVWTLLRVSDLHDSLLLLPRWLGLSCGPVSDRAAAASRAAL
jgi:hypothetical protein